MPTILIVDDHPANRQFVVTLLGNGGHRLLQAADGAAALAMVQAEHPDLVIADVRMPIMDGYEFVRQLRADPAIAATPVIFCTADYHEHEARTLAKAFGVAHVLTKPAEPDVVLRAVDAALAVVPTSVAPLPSYAELLRHSTELEREVAERKRTEDSLRENEEKFRSAFDHTNVAMVLTDLDNHFVRANQAFARMLGYEESEILKLSMADITHPDDRQESYARREELLAGKGNFFQQEKRYLHKNGHTLWGLTNVSLLRDAGRRPLSYVGQVQDITGRKEAEKVIDKYMERLRILHQIDRALIAGEGPAEIAAAALVPLRELLGVPRAIVNLFDLGKGEVEWLAAAGRRRVHVGPGVRYSIRLMGDVEALRRGEPQLVDTHALPPGPEVDALLASGVHAYIVVPMIAEGELIGALSFGGETVSLSTEQVSIAQEAAAQFAIALAQARLHEQVKRQAQELVIRVTERKAAEEALGQARERLAHVVASSPAVLYTLTLEEENLRTTWISENVQELLGYTAEEVFQPTWWSQCVHPDDLQRALAEMQRLLFTHDRLADEYRFRHKAGKYRWLHSEMRLLRNAAGSPVEVVGSWSDITERKRLEDQFRQVQKMEAIGQLAGGVAHDFNNLLTVINGYGELLLHTLPPNDPARDMVREMVAAGDRAAGLTRQLLAFSRRTILEPRVLNLSTVVTNLDKMLRRIIGEDIQLALVADPDVGAVKVDPGQIEQVILNLVVNARDAMPRGGRLTIEVRNAELDETYARDYPEVRPGPQVMLAVTDTGCGMDQETQARIFEPFFSTKGEKGTGLGLATVHGIIKQSGGHVAVYSEVGHGTAFKVYLPRIGEQSGSSHSHPGLAVMPRGTETVLLVEDEDAVRGLAHIVLQERGYLILEASNGAEAIEVAGQHQGRIDLLVTDVVMPWIGGRDLARHLTALYPHLKVLFLSGYTDDAVVRHGILEAEVAFLQKPFSPASLAAKVRKVLDAPKPASAGPASPVQCPGELE